MPLEPEEIARFIDRYGDERVVRRSKNGLALKRKQTTPVHALNRAAAILIAERIKEARLHAGFTLEELCLRAGLATVGPKHRMCEIEQGVRAGKASTTNGIRLGTLYALAIALEIEPNDLLPTKEEVMAKAGIRFSVTAPTLLVESAE